jgi:hypothetical protein
MPIRVQVVIEQDLLRKYPALAKLPEYIDFSRVKTFVKAIETRPEGMRTSINNNVLRISPRNNIVRGRVDYLGLEIPDEKLSEICDVIYEDTHVDPRREIYYSKRGSLFENFTEDAQIEPNFLRSGKKRERHPLDRVSCEEVILRRELAERRWEHHQSLQRSKNLKKRVTSVKDEKEIQHAVEFFFPPSSSRK